MKSFSANIRFNTEFFSAPDEAEADRIIEELIDQISRARTDIRWDDFYWDITERGSK